MSLDPWIFHRFQYFLMFWKGMMLLSMLRDRTRGLFASNDIQAPPGADVHYLHIFYLGFGLLKKNYIVLVFFDVNKIQVFIFSMS